MAIRMVSVCGSVQTSYNQSHPGPMLEEMGGVPLVQFLAEDAGSGLSSFQAWSTHIVCPVTARTADTVKP